MPSWKKVHAFVELIRPYNASAALLAFFIGLFFGNLRADWVNVVEGIVVVALFHSIATVQNDIEDVVIDSINAPQRVLQRNALSLSEARYFLYGLYICLFLVGTIATEIHKTFVILTCIIVWLYNNKPFQLSRKPIMSITILGLAYTLLPMAYGFFLAGNKITSTIIVWFMGWFFVRSSISILKDYKDVAGDLKYHKQTFYLQFGSKKTAQISWLCAAIGYLLVMMTSAISHNAFFLILPLVFAIFSFIPRKMLFTTDNLQKKNRIFHTIFFRENRFELIYLLWIFLLK